MFKLVEDMAIGELSYRCTACGDKQYCYTDLAIIPCCTKCFKMLNPHPYRLFFSQVYRKRYHLRKEAVNVVKTQN